jgi:hypothetical protein
MFASLRAKRSNPEAARKELDCFVARAPRNDGVTTAIILRGVTEANSVMAGLVPAIHVFLPGHQQDVDARDICAKTRFAL